MLLPVGVPSGTQPLHARPTQTWRAETDDTGVGVSGKRSGSATLAGSSCQSRTLSPVIEAEAWSLLFHTTQYPCRNSLCHLLQSTQGSHEGSDWASDASDTEWQLHRRTSTLTCYSFDARRGDDKVALREALAAYLHGGGGSGGSFREEELKRLENYAKRHSLTREKVLGGFIANA